MASCLKLKKLYGEAAKNFLKSKSWLDGTHTLGKTMNYLFLPLTKSANFDKVLEKFPNSTIENRNLPELNKQKGDFKSMLKKVMPSSAIKDVIASFDVVGDIAIIEVPEKLKKHEVSIAWTLKRTNSNINVVAKKESTTKGQYRIRSVKVLVGEDRTETIYKENGVRFKVDLNKAYFSPRLGQERLRVSNLVKKNEKVLVMFAGIGPYALVIAKKQPSAKITGIEANHDAIKYFKENLALNKNIYADKEYATLGKKPIERIRKAITVIEGDVKDIVPKLKEKFDRIIMPLPQEAYKYLDVALKVAKKGAMIHLYYFCKVGEEKTEVKKLIVKKTKPIKVVKCGAYAPRVNRVCADLKVL